MRRPVPAVPSGSHLMPAMRVGWPGSSSRSRGRRQIGLSEHRQHELEIARLKREVAALRKDLRQLNAFVVDVVGDAVAQLLAEARIELREEFEARTCLRYLGVHTVGRQYAPGDIVTRSREHVALPASRRWRFQEQLALASA